MEIDERRWAERLATGRLPFRQQQAMFRSGRQELVAVLSSLRDEEWLLAGNHERIGRVAIVDLARSIAEHETEHLGQIEAWYRNAPVV